MTKKIPPYLVFEGFCTLEQCTQLAEYFLSNEDYDPREFYGNYGLGGPDEFFGPNRRQPSFDPDDILLKVASFAKKQFQETYEMVGTFGLNRSHANYMHEGAELFSHNDDRIGSEPVEGLNSRTYVCGLFLTDNYEGGELVFEEEGVSLKPKAGDLVLFPGFYTRHGVNKVTKGTRLNILTHFFDVRDTSIPYTPKYALDPNKRD
jgi:hypothetical protein